MSDLHARAKNMADEGAVACIRLLMNTYLHLQCWATEHYPKIEPQVDREEFESMVKSDDLFETVECVLKSCLFARVPLKDSQISECLFAASAISSGRPLTEAERNNLGIGWQEMFVKLIRFEVATEIALPKRNDVPSITDPPEDPTDRKAKEAMAIAALVQDPDARVTDIAKDLGVPRTTVYSYPGFKEALNKVKGSRQDRTARRGIRTAGGIDGVD